MQKKIILSLVFCITALSSFVYSGGNGTEASPYLISSKADREALATAVNAGNAYSGKYFLLTQSLTGITTVIVGRRNGEKSKKEAGANHSFIEKDAYEENLFDCSDTDFAAGGGYILGKGESEFPVEVEIEQKEKQMDKSEHQIDTINLIKEIKCL